MNSCKSLIFVLCAIFLAMDVLGQASFCQKITGDKELCNEIGQMLIIGFGGFKQDESGKVLWNDKDGAEFNKKSVIARHIADDNIGGVILFLRPYRDINTGQFVRDRNIQSPTQVKRLNQDLQSFNAKMRQNKKISPMPLFISVDQEGGYVDRLPACQGFPAATVLPQALGAKEEIANRKAKALNETYVYAKKMAQELVDLNFNLNFAPVVDVNVDPTNPIIGGKGRSFSSDPKIVIDQAKQFVQAFRENGIVSVLKHFPGHGSSSGDSHIGLVDVTDTYKKDKELLPYSSLIKSGFDDMIMTTHVINGQIDKTQCKPGSVDDRTSWCPGTMSKIALTNLLRKQMGFQGIIISDDMTMGAITEEYLLSDALKNSLNAGVNIFIVANNYYDQTNLVIDTIATLVKKGDVKREKIKNSYNRIIEFKKNRLLPKVKERLIDQDFNFVIISNDSVH